MVFLLSIPYWNATVLTEYDFLLNFCWILIIDAFLFFINNYNYKLEHFIR